jgi:hypothetical protein
MHSCSGVQCAVIVPSVCLSVRTTSVKVSVARVASGTCGREDECVHGVVGEPEGKIQVVG